MKKNKKDKRTPEELFAYADKVLSKLSDEEKDQVRRYLKWKFQKKGKLNMRNKYA